MSWRIFSTAPSPSKTAAIIGVDVIRHQAFKKRLLFMDGVVALRQGFIQVQHPQSNEIQPFSL
jgi:hypothetical protein